MGSRSVSGSVVGRRYEGAQLVITCRVATTDFEFEQYRYVEVADFTDQQIRAFATRWFPRTVNAEAFLTSLFDPRTGAYSNSLAYRCYSH